MQVNRIKTNDLKNEFEVLMNDKKVFEGSSQEALFFLLRHRAQAKAEERMRIEMMITAHFGAATCGMFLRRTNDLAYA